MAKKSVKKQAHRTARIGRSAGPKSLDWTRIEADYCTGQYTGVELAIRHGVQAPSISRRKTADQRQDPARWQKDNSPDVARVRAALLLDPSSLAVVKPSATLAAAMAGVAVVMRHRGDLMQARETALKLLDELGTTTKGAGRFRELVASLASAAELDQPARVLLLDQVREFMRLHQRASTMLKLMSALTAVHDGERRAFNLDDDPGKRAGAETQLSDIERSARVLSILQRGRAQRDAKAAATLPGAHSEAVLPALAAPAAPESTPGQAGPVH